MCASVWASVTQVRASKKSVYLPDWASAKKQLVLVPALDGDDNDGDDDGDNSKMMMTILIKNPNTKNTSCDLVKFIVIVVISLHMLPLHTTINQKSLKNELY